MTFQEWSRIQEEGGEDYDILTNSPEKLTLNMIILDTEHHQGELGKIKKDFVNNLYSVYEYNDYGEKGDYSKFGRYYTTINDLVYQLEDKEFDQDLHYFRNTINEDITPKTLDELYAINALLPEKQKWQILQLKQMSYTRRQDTVYGTEKYLVTMENHNILYDNNVMEDNRKKNKGLPNMDAMGGMM